MRVSVRAVVYFDIDEDWISDKLNELEKERIVELLIDEQCKIKSGEFENAVFGTIIEVSDIVFNDDR